jgi:tetratricopeptide (TPR) repeat protein
MRAYRVPSVIVLSIFGLVSCNRDPNVAKQRYLESGNKYFEHGNYKSARIRYKNALDKDRRFGPAYYRLGLTELKLNKFPEAVQAFHRAIELPLAASERRDAMVKMSEIYLTFAKDQKEFLDEVEDCTTKLLKEDPNSFDGHRLHGSLKFARALLAYQVRQRDEGEKLLDEALKEYTRAESIKAGDPGVLMQLARIASLRGDLAGSEKYYRQVIDHEKTEALVYSELYKVYAVQKRFPEAEQVLKLAYQNNPKRYDYLTSLALHYWMLHRTEDMTHVLQQLEGLANEFQGAYLFVGDFYLRLGDGDSAMREYRAGMSKFPKDKRNYQKRVIEVLMRQGKRKEAADLNAQILKEDPKDADCRGLAATFLLDQGDVTRALTELQAVVTQAPDNPVARYNLGRAHAAKGEWEQARQAFQKAIELKQDFLVPRLALAQLQVLRGEFDAAMGSTQAILKLDPQNSTAHMIESAALLGQKKYDESRALLNTMLKANPDSPDINFQLGVTGLLEKKYKESEDSFRKAFQLNPANSRGLVGLVEIYLAQNKPDAALSAIQAEVDKAPNRQDLRMLLANTDVRLGKFDRAITEYQKVLGSLDKNSKQRTDLYIRLGETYRRKMDDVNAIAALQKAREADPENTTVLTMMGLVFDHAGRWQESKQAYEAVLKINASNGVALNNLAFLMAEHDGDLNDALTKGQKAKQLMPNLPEVSDTLGWIYLKKNMTDESVRILQELVNKVPSNPTFRYHFAVALSQKGDKPKAIRQLQEALKTGPEKGEKDKIQQMLSRLQGA